MNEREQLEAEHVAAGVAKWGEAERAGLVAQAKKMALGSLRAESDLRNKGAYSDKAYGRTSTNIAKDCTENGFS